MNNSEKIINDIQEIIDFIAANKVAEANSKLLEVSEYLDDLLDTTEDDDTMIELSKYQVLLNHLNLKINP
ncbi:MAG: hypothetical protein ACH34V_05405 [Flavobacterium sp.]|uniref:Uncharacterized protein n=1 Tax=Flavobacterium celericrescens TaxID=2709780 RepID=A0ABX0IAE6_9FLAO|nr:hypothetical protein [Flavobacterium celericrescens]NHM04149.1 hypothetical protein [Flavobacterium celericrescens]